MEEFLKSIANREYAIISLVVVFFLFVFFKSDNVRKSTLQVLKLTFCPKMLLLYLIPVSYLSVITLMMYRFDIWDLSLLKDSIISVVYGILIVCKSISNENFKLMYKEYLLGYMSFTYLWEFIVGTYDFNFFAEILFVAFVSLLAIMSAYMNYQKDTPLKTKKFINGILSFVGILLLWHCVSSFLTEPEQILNIHSLQILALPIMYAIVLIPVCYFVWIYCKYESLLCSLFVLKNNLKQNTSEFQMTLKTICLCGVNIERINLWRDFFQLNYGRHNKTSDFDMLITEFKLRYNKINANIDKK